MILVNSIAEGYKERALTLIPKIAELEQWMQKHDPS